MIRKLKIKFILLAIVSVFSLLSLLVVGMNMINYTAIVSDVDEILILLSHNKGTFPGMIPSHGGRPELQPEPPNLGEDSRLPGHMSPELPYESRFFSVLLEADGTVAVTDVSRIFAVDEDMAADYALLAEQKQADNGFIDRYRYIRFEEEERVRYTFLDCGRRLDSFQTFLYSSIIISLVGFLIVSLTVAFFAGKMIRPIAESYEKQKRFITDAGHEMKTPLTIIRANADILSMELVDNESLSDIVEQTKRLTALTSDLVYLARMEENERQLPMIEFPISDIVKEAADPFRALMDREGKCFTQSLQSDLSLVGNDKAIIQLVSILLDNACKYTKDRGGVSLSLVRQGRNIVLTVTNETEALIEPSHLSRIFDRFYRTDASRHSGTGGHGIGLSIAKAIVQAHGGKISASVAHPATFSVTVVLPQ